MSKSDKSNFMRKIEEVRSDSEFRIEITLIFFERIGLYLVNFIKLFHSII